MLKGSFLTDYLGIFIQGDPSQQQKFLEEMSLSLSEDIHKTQNLEKRKLCFLLLSEPVPHLIPFLLLSNHNDTIMDKKRAIVYNFIAHI